MSRFENNLWESVLEAHGDALAEAEVPVVVPVRPGRRGVAFGVSAAVAVAAVAVTLILSASTSPPAYAVTRQHDGAVLVKITRPSGIAPANARLAAMGVPAYLVAVNADPRGVCAHAGPGPVATVRVLAPSPRPAAEAPAPVPPAASLVAPRPVSIPGSPRVRRPVPTRRTGVLVTPRPGPVAPRIATLRPHAGRPLPSRSVPARARLVPLPVAVCAPRPSAH